MTDPVSLRGMTWSDPRGYDPMIATSAAFSDQNPAVQISWDKRSLQGFESTPVDELAAEYDLMIIDHPHVGTAARQGCLLPIDQWIDPAIMAQFANETVGKSYVSYSIDGHQWALPVDAATQVQAHRPDLCDRIEKWADFLQPAKEGHVLLPLRPPHNLMCLYTLAANIGHPCGSSHEYLLPIAIGESVMEAIKAITDHVDGGAHSMDPIAALDCLAESQQVRSIPLTYLYKGYAEVGYRSHRVAFTDIPVMGLSGPIGSALGGTGLAISSRTNYPEICAAYATFVAGAACQSGLYARSNGQPGNAVAWSDAAVNKPVHGAYYNTRMSHEAAWLRPRHDNYMHFQHEGSDIVSDILKGKTNISTGMAALNKCFAASHQ